jgi:hypothetical protein
MRIVIYNGLLLELELAQELSVTLNVHGAIMINIKLV